jgi:hypothetical protein
MWPRSRPPSGARKMVERLESPGSWLGSIETGIIDLDDFVRGESLIFQPRPQGTDNLFKAK